MKGMSETEPLFVLFDNEEEYTLLMSDYLKNYRGLPWKVHSYTGESELLKAEQGKQIAMLVVAESSMTERVKGLAPSRLVVLNESGYLPEDSVESIDKYQAAETVLQMLIQSYLEVAGERGGKLSATGRTRFIGVYSPVKRSLQTTFALTLSELLSEKCRTLYLNFEHYSGVVEILAGDGDRDLADLVYFMNVDTDKFRLHLQTMLKQINEMVFVPPMRYGQNLLSVTESEWLDLLKKIDDSGLFDYVILDLTDCLQGLPEILRICNRVYTLMKDDTFAKVKMMQYENMLSAYEYGDILEKTERFVFPKFRNFPVSPDQFNRGDIADFVRQKMEETGIR